MSGFEQLQSEEAFLWEVARNWRSPQVIPTLDQLDGTRLVESAVANRMQVLLQSVLSQLNPAITLSPAAAEGLQLAVDKFRRREQRLGRDLQRYLHHAAQQKQEVVVIKGLWLSQKIYGDAGVRPGGDIDLLLRRRDISAALQILEEQMGYGRWWRPLLDDTFYWRHHLHQQRCNADRSIWIEPHWLLDHPYCRLTIDYEAMMDRATPGKFLGESVTELDPADLLLSLAIHLVKHAVYLPYVLERKDLPRLILADGMLMYFIDVAEVIAQMQDRLDWTAVVSRARSCGGAIILGAVLRVCHDMLDAPVPQSVLTALGAVKGQAVTSWIMQLAASYQVQAYEGDAPDGIWPFLLGFQETAVFRPIRLLDFWHLLFPGQDYLRRRYGRDSSYTAAGHLFQAIGRIGRVAIDTAYFTWKRRRQVAILDKEGYVWPELPENY